MSGSIASWRQDAYISNLGGDFESRSWRYLALVVKGHLFFHGGNSPPFNYWVTLSLKNNNVLVFDLTDEIEWVNVCANVCTQTT